MAQLKKQFNRWNKAFQAAIISGSLLLAFTSLKAQYHPATYRITASGKVEILDGATLIYPDYLTARMAYEAEDSVLQLDPITNDVIHYADNLAFHLSTFNLAQHSYPAAPATFLFPDIDMTQGFDFFPFWNPDTLHFTFVGFHFAGNGNGDCMAVMDNQPSVFQKWVISKNYLPKKTITGSIDRNTGLESPVTEQEYFYTRKGKPLQVKIRNLANEYEEESHETIDWVYDKNGNLLANCWYSGIPLGSSLMDSITAWSREIENCKCDVSGWYPLKARLESGTIYPKGLLKYEYANEKMKSAVSYTTEWSVIGLDSVFYDEQQRISRILITSFGDNGSANEELFSYDEKGRVNHLVHHEITIAGNGERYDRYNEEKYVYGADGRAKEIWTRYESGEWIHSVNLEYRKP